MWCTQCRQDVPGIVSAGEGRFACPRCAEILCESSADSLSGTASEVGASDDQDSAASQVDSWEVDEQLRHIQRLLRVERPEEKRSAAEQQLRLDASHPTPTPGHLAELLTPNRNPSRPSAASGAVLSAFTWAALLLGTMGFACGGILLGWSLWAERTELWNLGVPITLCGLIVLLLGLILQLDQLWHDSRRAAAKLDQVDRQLSQLNSGSRRLDAGPSSPSDAFYTHLSAGANPELLLSDLKSQLDLLAAKLDEHDG